MIKEQNSLIGNIYDRLTVIKWASTINYKRKWECICLCGNIVIRDEYNLLHGKMRSCGCYVKELQRKLKTRHGHSGFGNVAPEYNIFGLIKVRCTDKNNTAYKDYGGRGITVCERWASKNGYENFLEDMGRRPSPEHQIDRIDNNKGYCKENCRWVTRKINCNNRRSNRNLTYNGETLNIQGWSEKLGINYDVLYNRVHRNWSVIDIFEKPIRKSPTKKIA